MKTHITLILDQRRMKKNGKYPLIFRLTHNRKTTSISTGFSILKDQWNEKKSDIKSNYKEVESVHFLNTLLLKENVRMNEIINKLYDRGELRYFSINQVKDRISKKVNYNSFIEYGSFLVEELISARRFGTARSYKFTLTIMKNFSKKNDLKFNEVNYEFLKKFEKFHLTKKDNNLNGLAAYMRTIRSIYNKGIKDGCIDKEAYPFSEYKIRTTSTKKRAIDITYIKKILDLELRVEHELFHTRNYFLISYMLYGMPFMDMAFLKVGDIKNGRVLYQRKKTLKSYDIKISKRLEEILKFYKKGKIKNEFVFPIIRREKPEHQYLDVIGKRKKYNDELKKIAIICNIEQSLTSYVSRHSFATNAMLQDIPLQAISAMLGHSKLNTTQIYLKSLPNEVLDTYNQRISIF
ncbi:site-specific integrase [Cellulophaga tyrosinoxydans]|uniref:Site-specific recombinase XerD n=1 Tax=Cellulophaga tyrosinoxydans TaxID=504486 RepID=A0A1W1YUS2_9FLAO|nr:site-specific integrase [Cellulophaga tyrosinoxydans]SMC39927.1 Site-specific recombinase XerD [Cellulophaga tyrosinoxydans]